MPVKNMPDSTAHGDWLASLTTQEWKPHRASEPQKEAEREKDAAPVALPQQPARPGRGKLFWLLAAGVIVLSAALAAMTFVLVHRDPMADPTPPPTPAPSAEPVERTEVVVSTKEGEGDYQSLSQAVSQARPGMRIRVKPGLYRESLTLEKPVEIIGDGPAKDVIIESANANCLWIQSDGVLVRGLSLRTSSEVKTSTEISALRVTRGRPRVEDCDITSESGACVAILEREANPTLVGCTIHDGKQIGVLGQSRARGILRGCQIFGNGATGVGIATGANLVLTDCVIRNNQRDGLAVSEGLGLLTDCIIADNSGCGVVLRHKDTNLMLRNCVIRQNTLSGVAVYQQAMGTLDGCQISDSAQGADVAVLENAKLFLHSCKIFGGKDAGVLVRGGWSSLQGCEIRDHRGNAAIAAANRANLAVCHCRLHDNQRAWYVTFDSSVIGTGNQPPQP